MSLHYGEALIYVPGHMMDNNKATYQVTHNYRGLILCLRYLGYHLKQFGTMVVTLWNGTILKFQRQGNKVRCLGKRRVPKGYRNSLLT